MTDDREASPPPLQPPAASPPAPPAPGDDEVISLQDLAPRHDVRGGAGKLLFGQDAALRLHADD